MAAANKKRTQLIGGEKRHERSEPCWTALERGSRHSISPNVFAPRISLPIICQPFSCKLQPYSSVAERRESSSVSMGMSMF